MNENNLQMKKCDLCGKEVKAWDLNLWIDCGAYKDKSKEIKIGVRDLNTK